MSRARSIILGDEEIWFDTVKNGERAQAQHLELLALVEKIDIDDILDEHISQGEVIKRLRKELGQGEVPPDVLERREAWREARRVAPQCRICGQEHNSTKHHYVNKWILRELEYYSVKWADRSKNTIPICIDCHRDLHMREGPAKSIVPYLNEPEKAFAEAALEALSKQRPSLLILIARGEDSVYEARLAKDWIEGKFQPGVQEKVTPAKLLEQAA